MIYAVHSFMSDVKRWPNAILSRNIALSMTGYKVGNFL
jgi:hypothetical protein